MLSDAPIPLLAPEYLESLPAPNTPLHPLETPNAPDAPYTPSGPWVPKVPASPQYTMTSPTPLSSP